MGSLSQKALDFGWVDANDAADPDVLEVPCRY
jgi:hypothetical protein